jgi:hypothetical protein
MNSLRPMEHIPGIGWLGDWTAVTQDYHILVHALCGIGDFLNFPRRVFQGGGGSRADRTLGI